MDAGIRGRVLRLLVYGHVWLACGAAAQTWLMQHLMGRDGWRVPVLAALATFIGYAVMRTARAGHPTMGQAPQLRWAAKHADRLLAAAALAVAAAVVVAGDHLRVLALRCAPVALAVALYVVPARWTKGRTLGLRRVPLLKVFLIAACWAWVTVGLPATPGVNERPPQGTAGLFAMQMCFFMAIAMVFDLRDRDIDRGTVLTLPHLLGSRGTRTLAAALMLCPAAALAALAFGTPAWSAGHPAAPGSTGLAVAALAYLPIAVLVVRSTPARSAIHFGLLLDGALLLPPLVVALAAAT